MTEFENMYIWEKRKKLEELKSSVVNNESDIKSLNWLIACSEARCNNSCQFIDDMFCGKVEDENLAEDQMPSGATAWDERDGKRTAICRFEPRMYPQGGY